MSVGVDAMVNHLGTEKDSPQGQEEHAPKCHRNAAESPDSARDARGRKETVVVPSVAVAEVLLGVDEDEHGHFIAELQTRFFLPPFDLRATVIAAKLWQAHRELPKEDQIERKYLKADVMILATAKVAGATRFYSHERKLRKLADELGMEGRDLPLHSENWIIDLEARKEAEGPEAANQSGG
jgi:predicted nucleic acid-binding protein